MPSIQFFFGLPRALFCFGIHFNVILGIFSSAILWTWPYHVSWFCSIYFIIVSSSPICCLIVTFLILSFLDILEGLVRASIYVASTRLLLFSVSLHVSEPYNTEILTTSHFLIKMTYPNSPHFEVDVTSCPFHPSDINNFHGSRISKFPTTIFWKFLPYSSFNMGETPLYKTVLYTHEQYKFTTYWALNFCH